MITLIKNRNESWKQTIICHAMKFDLPFEANESYLFYTNAGECDLAAAMATAVDCDLIDAGHDVDDIDA